jgi:hypothetical protein
MRITQGTVVAGRIELEGEPLPEGTRVTVIAREGDESFTLNPEQEAELLLSIAEIDRGEVVDIDELIRELRS